MNTWQVSSSQGALTLEPFGGVDGDLGTSPPYVKKTFIDPTDGLTLTPTNLIGIV